MNERSDEQLEQPAVDQHDIDAGVSSAQDDTESAGNSHSGDSLPAEAPGQAEENQPAAESPADETAESPVEESATASPAEEPAATSEPAEESPAAEPAAPKPKRRGKAQPVEETPEEDEVEVLDRDWYILKVQSNREKSIRDALERRVKVAGLERFFGDIIVPTEDVAEYKNGKRRVTKRKLWPGYIVVNMAINDDTWFLVRETPGIGDFTGSIGKPTPMLPQEVERIIPKAPSDDEEDTELKTNIPFKQGDRVRVKDGYFQNFEGDVETVDEANGRVTVMISVFGRSTPVELEHWHIEDV